MPRQKLKNLADKKKVGEQNFLLAAAQRGKQVIVVGAYQIMSFIIDIQEAITGSLYRGDTAVPIKDSSTTITNETCS